MAVKRYDGSAWQTVAGQGAQGAAGADGTAPLTTKGDILTYGTAATRLAVGNNGETLVADSSATTGLRWQGDYATGKNFCINGDQAIAQRGTSVSSVTGSTYLTDRFEFNITTQGTWTLSQESDAPAGFSKSLKALVTTADNSPASTDRVRIIYKNEGNAVQRLAYGSASANTVTFSFWVKSNVTGTYVLELFNFGASQNRHIASTYSVSASATWEKKTITFTGDTVTAIVADNAERLSAIWYLGAGSDFTSGTLATTWANNVSANRAVGQTNVAAATNNYFQITGVQMEIGSVATAFNTSTGTLAGELAACQRYYYQFLNGNNKNMGYGMAISTTAYGLAIKLPVSMRTTPTLVYTTGTSYWSAYDGSDDAFDAWAMGSSAHTEMVHLDGTGNVSATQGTAQNIASNNASAAMGFSAEL